MKKFMHSVKKMLGAAPQPVAQYYFNDPTTPSLFLPTTIPVPMAKLPDFTVVGWNGQPRGRPGSSEFHATQVFVTIMRTLNMVQTLRNPVFINGWAGTANLVAIPRAGNQLNAYYDRVSLRFFYGPSQGKIVYAAESVDVVSHELGHAILDAIRPELWNGASLETFAYHESFGDIMAVCTLLSSMDVRRHVLTETAGDLMRPNIASKIAEEMGNAIFRLSGGKAANISYLRSSINPYAYAPPETLPEKVSDDSIAREPHSFSRIFTGAWYDCMSALYQAYATKSGATDTTLLQAMRDLLFVTLEATAEAPFTARFFYSVAWSMVNVARRRNDQLMADIITKCMTDRRILGGTSLADTKLMVAGSLNTAVIDPSVDGNQLRMCLSEPVVGETNIVVELPTYGIAGEMGEVTTHCAHECLHYIQSRGLVGNEYDNKMFYLNNGKLERNYICNAFRP